MSPNAAIIKRMKKQEIFTPVELADTDGDAVCEER